MLSFRCYIFVLSNLSVELCAVFLASGCSLSKHSLVPKQNMAFHRFPRFVFFGWEASMEFFPRLIFIFVDKFFYASHGFH